MIRWKPWILLSALAFVACVADPSTVTAPELVVAFDHDPATLGSPVSGEFEAGMTYRGTAGPPANIRWRVSRESGAPGSSGSVVLADGECATVYAYQADADSNNGLEIQTVDINLQTLSGYRTFHVLKSQQGTGQPIVATPEVDRGFATVGLSSGTGHSVVFINKVATGRMTGAGSITDVEGVRFSHEFTLHCDPTREPNKLQIKWAENRFVMEDLTRALCLDNPNIDPGTPRTYFDLFAGGGTGRLNGVPGTSISFVFWDAGEPGRSDLGSLFITPPGGEPSLFVSSTLVRGNHQARGR